MEDAPLPQRVRAGSQLEQEWGQDDAEFRDRFRLIPNDPATATGTAANVSTPNDIEDVVRIPMVGWAAYEVMCPMRPKNPFMRRAFEGISPPILLRGVHKTQLL